MVDKLDDVAELVYEFIADWLFEENIIHEG